MCLCLANFQHSVFINSSPAAIPRWITLTTKAFIPVIQQMYVIYKYDDLMTGRNSGVAGAGATSVHCPDKSLSPAT